MEEKREWHSIAEQLYSRIPCKKNNSKRHNGRGPEGPQYSTDHSHHLACWQAVRHHFDRKSHNKSLMEGSDKTSGGLLLTTLCDNTTHNKRTIMMCRYSSITAYVLYGVASLISRLQVHQGIEEKIIWYRTHRALQQQPDFKRNTNLCFRRAHFWSTWEYLGVLESNPEYLWVLREYFSVLPIYSMSTPKYSGYSGVLRSTSESSS